MSWRFVSIAALVLAMAGCSKERAQESGPPPEWPKNGLTEAQAGEVLVKVGDRTITVGEFADRLASQSPYLRARFESPERRREFLDNLVRYELLVYEAKRRGRKAKRDARAAEMAALRKENERLRSQLQQAELIIDAPKKLAAALQITLNDTETDA